MTNTQTSAKKEIPIFFSTDDAYMPFLDVAIRSLVEHTSADHFYRIIVLNTGVNGFDAERVCQSRRENVKIDFVDISAPIEHIRSHFKSVYHFSVITYYRMFIASLFPEYTKAVYLDCDLVVLKDIAALYETDLGENILGGTIEEFVYSTEEFRRYAAEAVGVPPERYINAGVLLMNLDRYRSAGIEERFSDLIKTYNFDTIDPDQAYLNFLCAGRIEMLPNVWNKEPIGEVKLDEVAIMHYALYKKPWQYNDVIGAAPFWQYAKQSPFYDRILAVQAAFDENERAKKEADAVEIKRHALRIVSSAKSFAQTLLVPKGDSVV